MKHAILKVAPGLAEYHADQTAMGAALDRLYGAVELLLSARLGPHVAIWAGVDASSDGGVQFERGAHRQLVGVMLGPGGGDFEDCVFHR